MLFPDNELSQHGKKILIIIDGYKLRWHKILTNFRLIKYLDWIDFLTMVFKR